MLLLLSCLSCISRLYWSHSPLLFSAVCYEKGTEKVTPHLKQENNYILQWSRCCSWVDKNRTNGRRTEGTEGCRTHNGYRRGKGIESCGNEIVYGKKTKGIKGCRAHNDCGRWPKGIDSGNKNDLKGSPFPTQPFLPMQQEAYLLGSMPGALSCDVEFGNSEVFWLSERYIQRELNGFHIYSSHIVAFVVFQSPRMGHIQRLYNVVNTWNGWLCIAILIPSQINAVVLVLWSEIPVLETFLDTIHHNHTCLILYVIDNRNPMKETDNCVYIKKDQGLTCQHYEDVIYPINLLRNLAIEATNTEYYINMDADIIPSRRPEDCAFMWSQLVHGVAPNRLLSLFQQEDCLYDTHIPVYCGGASEVFNG